MRRYKKGERVEVLLNTTLEHSWQPARIVKGRGDMYTVQYDKNEMAVKVVLVEHIRPCPPVVEFSNWCRGDLVHVFDNFTWKLATVFHVLEENKHFIVRVIGSMLDLIVNAAWIRVRHCWQDGRWILVGKGPSILDERQPCISNIISNPIRGVRATRRKTACQKSHNLSTRLIKMNALSTINQTDTGTGTGVRSRLTEEPQGSSHPPPRKNVTADEMNEKQENCGSSCVGSCSINTTNSSSNQNSEKYAEKNHSDGGVSDAESCTGTSHSGILVVQNGKKAVHIRLRGYGNCGHSACP